MKKNKILKLCMMMLICALCTINQKVKAYDNGTGSNIHSYSGGGSADCGSGFDFCQYDNRDDSVSATLKIQLFYINKGSYQAMGDPTYVAFDDTAKNKLISYGIDSSQILQISGYSVGHLKFQQASDALRDYFGDKKETITGNMNANLKAYFMSVCSEGDMSCYDKDTQNLDKTEKKVATKGYRLIVEPVVYYKGASASYVITPKEAAYLYVKGKDFRTSSFPLSLKQPGQDSKMKDDNGNTTSQAGLLYTEWDDVGISSKISGTRISRSSCDNADLSTLADSTNGCGMNIFDVGKYVQKKTCYKMKKSGSLTCVNYDKNNEGTFKEEPQKIEGCTEKQMKEYKDNGEYGKKIKNMTSCILYCKEEAFASLPGGITQNSPLGLNISENGYFAWPAKYGSKLGMQMYMKSTLRCRIVQKTNKKCSDDNIKSLIETAKAKVKDNTNNPISAKLTGGNYQPIEKQELVVGNEKIYEKNTTKLSIDKKTNVTKEFIVSKKTYLEIKSTTNRYLNKSTGEVSSDSSKWIGTSVFDRGQGVVSLSEKKTQAGKKYQLKLSDFHLGIGNKFGELIKNYTCNFTANYTPCVCPSDSLHPGDPLYDYITTGMTCRDLQNAQCYKQCTTESGSRIDISTCVNNKMKNDGLSISAAAKKCESETPACKKQTERCKTLKKGYEKEYDACMALGEVARAVCYNVYCTDHSKKICEKLNEGVTETEWYACMNNDNSNYDVCYEKYCSDDVAPCDDVDKKTWKVCMSTDGYDYDKCYDKYCLKKCEEASSTDWKTCRNEGYSYGYCYRKLCPRDYCKDCEYYCKTPSGNEINISQCISNEQKNNKRDFSDAKAYCSRQYCSEPGDTCKNGRCPKPNCTGNCIWVKVTEGKSVTYEKRCDGKVCLKYPVYCPSDNCFRANNVVYRTIDLNNPFPSNGNASTITGFSNDGIAGRIPSSNWYSEEIVSQDILNARGVKGNELYTKKTPLYIITLTPTTIDEIRRDNKNNEYSEFKLECKDGSNACISSFLHEKLLNLGALSTKGVNNCYRITTGSDASTFNACYNNNN